MTEPSRTQRYEGLYQSQTQELFETDARSAAEHGWYPVSQTWSGGALFVVFEHDPSRRWLPKGVAATPAVTAPSAAPAQGDAEPSSGLTGALTAILVGLIVLAVFGVAMVAFKSWDRPGTVTGRAVYMPTEAPQYQSTALGSRSAAIEFFQGRGYGGEMNPLNGGRERWLARDPLGSVAEVIGPSTAIDEVSLSLSVLADDDQMVTKATDLVLYVRHFAPAAADWVTDDSTPLDALASGGIERRFGSLTVRVSGVAATDGLLLVYTISAD